MAEARIIKKYSNRKLYDTVESRYITLDDIANLIQSQVEIKVIDNESGEDLSRQTLAQVVLEQEKKKKNLLPIPELKELIHKGSGSFMEYVRKSLGAGADAISYAEAEIDRLFRRLVERGQLTDEEARKLFKEMVGRFGQGRQYLESKFEERVQQALGTVHISSATELERLEERVEHLEARLVELSEQLQALTGGD
ncbi:MAG: phasin family protein [Candidatus Schekmanbacteria bacterium]|nr:phasin family protein [Candidatus Schekmanbacteria bacterium]